MDEKHSLQSEANDDYPDRYSNISLPEGQRSVIIFCAHNDDHTLGVGGTIAKYKKMGYYVLVVIFSYGENSHVWMKPEEVVKVRVQESTIADKVLGIDKTIYLGVKEGEFFEEVHNKNLINIISRFIKVLRPEKVFTHSTYDPHPDHFATVKTVLSVVDKLEKEGVETNVYSFDIWNFLTFHRRIDPRLVVDVTSTFDMKIESFKEHRSQWMTKISFIPATYLRGFLNGLNYNAKYAEVFLKIR